MSNKRKLSSQQSIDTIFKLSTDLRRELVKQLESFNSSKNYHLLKKLTQLPKFRNKKIKDQISYLEINNRQLEKIGDILSKLEEYKQLKNSYNDLKSKLDNMAEEAIYELILLPTKLYFEDESNDYEPNYESTNDEEKTNKIFSLVFKYLPIQDLLNCRLVNKKFKHFSDQTNGINKLIIGQPHCVNYWYYNDKTIEDKDIISLKCFRAIQKLSIFNLDTNLKYLKIYDDEFELEEISNLINLQSIEFGYYYKNADQQILNLNNLKIFISNGRSVQLNTPKLEKIQFWDTDEIKLNSNPESIKHLITYNYDNKLEIFKNLKIMELTDTHQPVDKNLLSLFKNLKQLKINLNFNQVNYSIEGIKNSLIKILNDKIKLKKVIDIYLEGIKVENIDKFNELVSIGDSFWKFILNNYDLLDLNLSFIEYLDYHELEECVNNIKTDLPSSFFDKFIYINLVRVDSVNDIDGLNWFLNKLKYLNELYIGRNVSLDEVFYNNLPNTIRWLKISNSEDINYEFILKLSKLISLKTAVDKDLFDLAFASFLNLKYLNRFIFNYKNKQIKIVKDGKYFDLNRRELDYNQLIEECNKIRSK